jgi:hypothetical protein
MPFPNLLLLLLLYCFIVNPFLLSYIYTFVTFYLCMILWIKGIQSGHLVLWSRRPFGVHSSLLQTGAMATG